MKLLLSAKDASEYLGVTVKTIKEWDYKGVLKPTSYTQGGHRRYLIADLNNFLNQRNKELLNSDNEEFIDDKLVKIIASYAKGVIQLTQAIEDDKRREYLKDFPLLWKKASADLHRYTLVRNKDSRVFPLTLPEQFRLWQVPLNEWPIPGFYKTFSEEENSAPVLYDYEITDYCREIAGLADDNQEILEFKEVMKAMKAKGDNEEYTKFRKFIVENPVINKDNLDIKILKSQISREYRENLRKFYVDIPYEFALDEGYSFRCPYCGWTLKKTDKGNNAVFNNHGVYNCNTDKCKTHAREWVVKEKIKAEDYYRVLPGIQEFIVEPGILEIRLYNSINLYLDSVLDVKEQVCQLYPRCDLADIEVKFSQNETWIVDVKDWKLPVSLAYKLNTDEPFQAYTDRKKYRCFIVVPDTYGSQYIIKLKKLYKKSNLVDIMHYSAFLKLFKVKMEVCHAGNAL